MTFNEAHLICCAAIALPWLNPFASGPTASVLPWLVSLIATIILLSSFLHASSIRPSDGMHPAPSWAFVIAVAWLCASLVSSVFGLLQYFGLASYFSPWVSEAALGEAYANLRQRNQFASLTNIGLVSLIWLTRSNVFQHQQWISTFAAAILACSNAASASRTGLMQLILLSALFLILWSGWRDKSVRTTTATAVISYGLSTLLLPLLVGFGPSTYGIFSRLLAGDALCASRLTLWANVRHLIAQKPWLGWGWGELDYAHYITHYDGPRFCDILDNAHNLPLHLAVELGVPVALLACVGVICWVCYQRPWAERDITRQLAWAVLGVILLHSLLEYPLWYGPFQVASGICICLLIKKSLLANIYSKFKSKVWGTPVLSRYIIVFLVLPCAYALWDYYRISQIYLEPGARTGVYRENTLAKIQASWLFSNQVKFAELNLTPLTNQNAQWTFDTASMLLHFSPEPRVIEKLIESAVMLRYDDEALAHMVRYRAAFPDAYGRWMLRNAISLDVISPQR